MIASRWLLLPALPVLIATSACSPWVRLTEGGTGVTHVTAATAADRCTRVGRVTAVTQHRVAGVSRNEERVRAELLTMARNEAAALGANSVVATSEITDGRQNFDALNCER